MTLESLPAEIELEIFKYVLCPRFEDREGNELVISAWPSSNSTAMRYSVTPMFGNISILLTSRAIYHAARHALYSYMGSLTLDLTVELATHLLLDAISPRLLKHIEILTFARRAFQTGAQNYLQQDTEWFVQQVLVGRMVPQQGGRGGRLRTVGMAMPDDMVVSDSDLRFDDDLSWEWRLAEQVIRAFVQGYFDSVRLVHPFSFPMGISPYAFYNIIVHLQRMILGEQRTLVILAECENRIEEYFQQHPHSSLAQAHASTEIVRNRIVQNSLVDAGFFLERESWIEGWGDVLVLKRLPSIV